MFHQRHPIEKNKLWVTGMSPDRSDAEIRSYCEEFGPLIHMTRTKNKTDVFLTYLNDKEAAEALIKIQNNRIRANYAYNKQRSRSDSLNSSYSSTNNQNGNSPSSSNQPSNNRRVHFSNGNSSERTISNVPVSNGVNATTSPVPVQSECEQNSVGVAMKTMFKNGDEIVMTHVTNDFKFYAHLKSQDDDYHDLIATVSKLAKDADELTKFPCRGSFVFAQHNGEFWRALVQSDIKAESDPVSVELIDIGLTLHVPFHKLREIFEEFTSIEIKLTHSFLLHDVDSNGAQYLYAAKYFRSMIGSTLRLQSNKRIVEPNSKVTLIDPRTKRNINLTIKQCMAKFTIQALIRRPIPCGKNQSLILVDDSKLKDGFNSITFIHQKDKSEYRNQIAQIQMVGKIFGDMYPPFTPSVDEVCLVWYDEHWHRGVLGSFSNIDQTKAVIYLIDLQIGIDVELKYVRKINEDLAKLPILTFSASAEGFESCIDIGNARDLWKKCNRDDVVCDVQDSIVGDFMCLIRI